MYVHLTAICICFGLRHNNIMEYVLFAFSNSQAPIKAKLSKLRHLDSLFFFLLIVALLFFQVFQHNQLRQDLLPRKTDSLLQELLQEKIPQLERQLEELRSILQDETMKIDQRLQQNKQITLVLGRELGLPICDIHEDKKTNVERSQDEQVKERRQYEIIEIESNSEEESTDYDHEEDNEEHNTQLDSFPQEQVISTTQRSPSCTYIQYLKQQQNSHRHARSPYLEKRHYRINTSSFVKKNGIQLHQQQLEEIKRIAEDAGKVILLGALIVGVLLLTFQKKRRGKHTNSFIRDLWRRIWPEERKRTVKEWKQQKELLIL